MLVNKLHVSLQACGRTASTTQCSFVMRNTRARPRPLILFVLLAACSFVLFLLAHSNETVSSATLATNFNPRPTPRQETIAFHARFVERTDNFSKIHANDGGVMVVQNDADLLKRGTALDTGDTSRAERSEREPVASRHYSPITKLLAPQSVDAAHHTIMQQEKVASSDNLQTDVDLSVEEQHAASARRRLVDAKRDARGVSLQILGKINEEASREHSRNQRTTRRPRPQLRRRPTPGPNRPCPAEYRLKDEDDAWFLKNVTQRSPLQSQSQDGDELGEILILSPISNSEEYLQRYFANLCSLSYPHGLVSVALGEDSSMDGTFDAARRHAARLLPYFNRIDVIKLRGHASGMSANDRHNPSAQFPRRAHLASSRNQLLLASLGRSPTAPWVLWVDSDVRHIPHDVIERLTAVQRQIVVPNCLYRVARDGKTETFDRNTWRETNESKSQLERAPPNFLMIEGYGVSRRRTLSELGGEGEVVRVDGVGGCVLLVEAQLHREGLVFPAFNFEHHVETEGLAKMAARMGVELYGLPWVNVIHA